MSGQSVKHRKRRSARQHPENLPENETQELLTHARVRLACWTLVFLAVLLSTRLVNLWHDSINPDEMTFIVMASGLLHGQLLYVDMFDVKPPGIFLALAGVMSLFGESLQVVRHFGTFCLLVAAVASYGIAIRHTTSRIAGLTIAAVMTLTGIENFQPTMTEHVVIVWLMPAIWLLVARRGVLWAIFLVGVLVSAATLSRTNVAYVVLALAGYYLWRWWHGRPVVSPWEIVAYGAGGLVPLVPLCLFYWYTGHLDDFVFVNVTLIAGYAYKQLGIIDAFLIFVNHLQPRVFDNFYASSITLFTIAGLCLCVVNWRKALLLEQGGPLVLVFGALGLSILQSGQAHQHYLLQVLPLVAVFTALGFGTLRRGQRDGIAAWAGMALSGLVLVSGLVHYGSASVNHMLGIPGESKRIGSIWEHSSGALVNHASGQWASIGRTPLQHAADVIREDAGAGPVWCPTHHLIYWYLKQPSPSKLVHPSSFGQLVEQVFPLAERGYLDRNELLRLITMDHGYIVMPTNSVETLWRHFTPGVQGLFDKVLAGNFTLWREVPGFVIYKRR